MQVDSINSTQLAIVIPAYKIEYLENALTSIAQQTNKNFNVYIGDDGSKADIRSVADKFADTLNINYHRFEDNLGGHDLVKQWNRCVELAHETWIWLFSDDDTMEPGCVQAFYNALSSTEGQHNVYRFNIEMIDSIGQIICVKDPHPQTESGYDFLIRRLQSRSLSAAVEYIFKKEVFIRHNGFVNFPLAFCSDDASWIDFAGDKPIYTIAPEKVYWRASGINISSETGLQHQKVQALLAYCGWVKNRFQDDILTDLEIWFFDNLQYIYGKLALAEKFAVAKKLAVIFNKNRFFYLGKLILYGKI